MRRVSRPWPLLVLIALAGLLGPPATASASDAGLRALVSQQRAEEKVFEKRLAAASKTIGRPSSLAALKRRVVRYLRTAGRILGQVQRSYDRYRPRFAAEAPETPESTRGRTLVMLGLRDGSRHLVQLRGTVRRAERAVRRARSFEAVGRIGERIDDAPGQKNAKRSDARLKRGRTLIRNAPAVGP